MVSAPCVALALLGAALLSGVAAAGPPLQLVPRDRPAATAKPDRPTEPRHAPPPAARADPPAPPRAARPPAR
jgi:hypothetical protein